MEGRLEVGSVPFGLNAVNFDSVRCPCGSVGRLDGLRVGWVRLGSERLDSGLIVFGVGAVRCGFSFCAVQFGSCCNNWEKVGTESDRKGIVYRRCCYRLN